jgi:hypothetical protein
MINLMQLIKRVGTRAATMASLMYLIDQNGIETKGDIFFIPFIEKTRSI